MWFICVEVEQETSATPPEKDPGSAPGSKTDPMLRAEYIFDNPEHQGQTYSPENNISFCITVDTYLRLGK